jgi:hypothetical protein
MCRVEAVAVWTCASVLSPVLARERTDGHSAALGLKRLVRALRRRRLSPMSWWWLLLFLLVPVAWVLLQTVVGFMTPSDASGRFYLRTQLKSAGVLHLVPDGCIRELVNHNLAVAQMMSRMSKEGVRTEMVKMLDGTTTLVTVWITGEDLPIKPDGVVPRTLVKYGIQRGALKAHGTASAGGPRHA